MTDQVVIIVGFVGLLWLAFLTGVLLDIRGALIRIAGLLQDQNSN